MVKSTPQASATNSPSNSLARRALIRYCIALAAVSVVLFASAGTFGYWQAKLYIAVLFPAVFLVGVVMLRVAPDLVERRLHHREERREQKMVMRVGAPLYLLIYLVPGIDRRFGFSDVPEKLVYTSVLLVLVSYGLLVSVLFINRFASRVIKVEKNQKVISSGPYAYVRHPMYSFLLPICVFTPLALGSWWAMIPAVAFIPILVFRLLDEEKALQAELEGYAEYMKKTRYRLIPGVY
jgi:protein-S-isoprenylcysteine O-methyltransferase Ste14